MAKTKPTLEDYIFDMETRPPDHGTPNDQDLWTQLQKKESDLLLAAELGKALLEKNEELARQQEKIIEEYSKKLEVSDSSVFLILWTNWIPKMQSRNSIPWKIRKTDDLMRSFALDKLHHRLRTFSLTFTSVRLSNKIPLFRTNFHHFLQIGTLNARNICSDSSFSFANRNNLCDRWMGGEGYHFLQ